MADKYVRSGATGLANGSSWANAYTTLSAAFGGMVAGDRAFVADDHSENTAGGLTLTSPGTAALPCYVIFTDTHTTEPPTGIAAKGAGGVITNSTNAAISFAGFCIVTGGGRITATGTGTSAIINFTSSNPWYWKFCDDFKLSITGTATNQRINIGVSGNGSEDDQRFEGYKLHFEFGGTGQGFLVRCPCDMKEGSVEGSTIPTTLFAGVQGNSGFVRWRGADLSAIGTGKNLVDVAVAMFNEYDFENCKLGSSVSITTGTHPGQGGVRVRAVNCDSADTNYRYYYQDYSGTITHETTIVRSGGASDGTTNLSRKMTSSANVGMFTPLYLDCGVMWNETLTSQTITVFVLTDNVTLDNDEAWLEAEVLATSGSPTGTCYSDRAAHIFSTPAAQDSDTSTWTTTGLGTPVKQKLSVTFTAAEKGPIHFRIALARPSTTMYVDPLAVLS